MQKQQHATFLNVVPTVSLPSLPSLPTLLFPRNAMKEKANASSTSYKEEFPVFLPQDGKEVQKGRASWYGPGFHGKRTANGEVYNQHELTAAHRTLPMGTRAIVTNVDTGESVEVRINDRGPYKYGRLIDLSYAAARRISVWAAGTAAVQVQVLNPDRTLPTEKLSTPSTYAVLLASSTNSEEISSLMSELSRQQPDAYLSSFSSGMLQYYQLRLGPFRSRNEAAVRAEELTKAGMQALVVAEDDRRVER